MLEGVLQNLDIIPLVLISLSGKHEIEETVGFCEFLTTPSQSWFPPAVNVVPESPYKMAFDLYKWLQHDQEAPEWFKLKGGLKAYEELLSTGSEQ